MSVSNIALLLMWMSFQSLSLGASRWRVIRVTRRMPRPRRRPRTEKGNHAVVLENERDIVQGNEIAQSLQTGWLLYYYYLYIYIYIYINYVKYTTPHELHWPLFKDSQPHFVNTPPYWLVLYRGRRLKDQERDKERDKERDRGRKDREKDGHRRDRNKKSRSVHR